MYPEISKSGHYGKNITVYFKSIRLSHIQSKFVNIKQLIMVTDIAPRCKPCNGADIYSALCASDVHMTSYNLLQELPQ
jgi:hypothetical protein